MDLLTVKFECPDCEIKAKRMIGRLGPRNILFKTEKEWLEYRIKADQPIKKANDIYIVRCWFCEHKHMGLV